MAVPKESLKYIFRTCTIVQTTEIFECLLGAGTPEMKMAKAKLAETRSNLTPRDMPRSTNPTNPTWQGSYSHSTKSTRVLYSIQFYSRN